MKRVGGRLYGALASSGLQWVRFSGVDRVGGLAARVCRPGNHTTDHGIQFSTTATGVIEDNTIVCDVPPSAAAGTRTW